MSYRSQWQLQVVGDQKKVSDLIAWMEEKKNAKDNPDDPYGEAECYKWILSCKQYQAETGEGVVFGDDSSKCYGSWDNVISDIITYGRAVLGLEVAYGRIGEELSDVEFNNDTNTYVEYRCELIPPDWA